MWLLPLLLRVHPGQDIQFSTHDFSLPHAACNKPEIPPDYLAHDIFQPSQVYTNIRKFREDLANYPPHHFVCVPMVLDTLYGRVSLLVVQAGNILTLYLLHPVSQLFVRRIARDTG